MALATHFPVPSSMNMSTSCHAVIPLLRLKCMQEHPIQLVQAYFDTYKGKDLAQSYNVPCQNMRKDALRLCHVIYTHTGLYSGKIMKAKYNNNVVLMVQLCNS